MRKRLGVSQAVVGDSLGLSVSEVSRLERGLRQLRVAQLGKFARGLGMNVEVLLWEGPEAAPLDADGVEALSEVAAAWPHLPIQARKALRHEMRLWQVPPDDNG